MTELQVLDALKPFALVHGFAGEPAPGDPLPEDAALETYCFLPFHRTGAAAGLTEPFDVNRPVRARLRVRVPLQAGAAQATAEHRVALRGPGDVVGVEESQVVRRFPEAGSGDADPLDLVHIEFNAPDLPWQYTPTGPAGPGGRQLPSWLRLVVVRWTPDRLAPPRGPGLPRVLTSVNPKAELPPEGEAWAWAHVQALGGVAGAASVAHRLAPGSPATTLSRLVCPTRLQPDTRWIAAVVPTFAVGVTAGLGRTPPADARLAFSWSTASTTPIDLPAYLHWEFQTSHDVNFEELARRLHPAAAKGDVGARRLDAGAPGAGIPTVAQGRARQVSGPLIRPDADAHDGKSWPARATKQLRDRIEEPDRTEYAAAPAKPTVGPPLYGGAHLAQHTLAEDPGATPNPPWLGQLNLDPTDRVAAGLGVRVVQMDQEDLMARAWAQVEGVLAGNDALRQAQFARWVGGRLHARHLERMSPAGQLAVTAPVQAALARTRDVTLWGTVEESATPRAATGATMRRLARPTGPVARFAGRPAARVAQVGALLATGKTSASWVLPDTVPDGVLGVRKGAAAVLARLADTDRKTVFAAANDLGRGALMQGGASLQDAMPDDWVQERTDDALRRALYEVLVVIDGLDLFHAHAFLSPSTVLLLRALPDLIAQVNAIDAALRESVQEIWAPRRLSAQLEVDGEPFPDLPGALTVDRRTFLERLRGALSEMGEGQATPVPYDEVFGGLGETAPRDVERIAELVTPSGNDPIVDKARAPIRMPALKLVDRLRPELTVGQHINFRLQLPDVWPFRDWLVEGRLEEVMAAPQFNTPLYQALDRYDREWLLPGVSRIEPPEMVTVLKSNARFMEAFLVGANHEMARELLWREYPTDGRATCFRSFWTPTEELTQPVHRMRVGQLGSHIDPKFDGMLVLLVRGELVRRYPGVLAHAVTEIAPPAGGKPPRIGATPKSPLFQLPLDPNLLLIGFDLTVQQVDQAQGATPSRPWWFTLSEHVGEPRFGLDSGAAHAVGSSVARDDLTWGDFGRPAHVPGAPPSGLTVTYPATVGADAGAGDAARTAYRLFQLPARAAFRASRMVHPEGPP